MDDDLKQFGKNYTGDALFDASQYAFFGNDTLVDEAELGGFEDDDLHAVGSCDQEYSINREESEEFKSFSDAEDLAITFSKSEEFKSFSDAEDLASTFSKLNTAIGGPRDSGVISHRGSREWSSAAECTQDEYPDLFDQQIFDSDTQEERRGSPHPRLLDPHFAKPNTLHRTSSYPEHQQQHQQHQQYHQRHLSASSEPDFLPKSSYVSYPRPGVRSQQGSPNNHTHHLLTTHLAGRPHVSSSPPNLSAFSNSQVELTCFNHGLLGGNAPQFSSRPPNQLVNQTQSYPVENINGVNGLLQQQLNHQNVFLPPQPQQHRLPRPVPPPPYDHLSSMQSQLFNPHVPLVPPPIVNKFGSMTGTFVMRDQRPVSFQNSRENMPFRQQGFDYSSQKNNVWWPHFRAKYMTPNEIENIFRAHLAATLSNDPYVDDYYNQARLAKKSVGARLKSKHNFCPINLSDVSSRAHPNSEPHAFLQVDALGRIPFSSIRRPRPLLEVNSSNSTSSSRDEQIVSEKPLEQETIVVARVTIEDGLSILLDVDDIDRFLQFNQLQDSGAQLRQRRQVMLEGLASFLQLVDLQVGPSPKDDTVFLRIISLPKGRKLLSTYLQHLSPNSELLLIACMTIFRNLGFLFGDPVVDESTANLATVLASSVSEMDLGALSACLAAVVCSSEELLLGNLSGDEASLILKSVLHRATSLLTNPHGSSNFDMNSRALWQTSFNQFFNLLAKYCVNKYDSITSLPNMYCVGSDAAIAISKEMPVDILRASLPHTNEHQRKLLLNFTKRSMPVTGIKYHCA